MERAIKKGYIVWHALPFTTHSELMDKDLLEYGISLSEELDRRYTKKTIAAKLTDVPGHTKAMIDILAQHGIKFLHIGVNSASAVPEVPQIFLWRSDNNNEIVVNYEGDYGHAYKNDELEEELITKGKRFGVIEYQILNVKDYIFWFDNYIRDFEITKEWSQLDFSKAGIERYEKVIEDGWYAYKFKSLFLKREDNYDSILVEYNINEVLSNDYGAPRIVQVKYCFHKEFNAFDYEINWFNKDANRMPEAIWVNFNLNLKDIDSWRMKKINSYLHLRDIATNGNRNLSAVEELKYEKDGKQLIIRNIHAPLFSMGKGKILQFDNKFEELNDGISFNLYNNVWGTNFPMWYEDDARFVFRFEYSNNSTEN